MWFVARDYEDAVCMWDTRVFVDSLRDGVVAFPGLSHVSEGR